MINCSRNTLKKHARIIFNDDNYSDEWVKEAKRRGLLNLASTPEALPYFIADKNIKLFETHGILTRDEVVSRYEIMLENYSKVINIEALTMLEMARQDIIPAVCEYIKLLSDETAAKKLVCASVNCSMEENLISTLSDKLSALFENLEELDKEVHTAHNMSDAQKAAEYYHGHRFGREWKRFAVSRITWRYIRQRNTGLSRLTATFCSVFRND